ncbi:MAG: hypothetical protein ACE367_02100 [Acidimicrobiales bacterium]
MSQTTQTEAPALDGIHFVPGPGYRWLGFLAGLFIGAPMIAVVLSVGPVAAPIAVVGLIVAILVAYWGTAERAWVGPEGVWIRAMPLLRRRYIHWAHVEELALPSGGLRSPWFWLSTRERVRLPLFVDSETFGDAVAIYAPEVMSRTSEVILHTQVPRGRWIEGVWHCDAHRRKWCKPCNDESKHRPRPGGYEIDLS